jgi:hypothetical protein
MYKLDHDIKIDLEERKCDSVVWVHLSQCKELVADSCEHDDELVADSCEHDSEPFGPMKDGKFIYQLSDYYLIKKDSAVWNLLWLTVDSFCICRIVSGRSFFCLFIKMLLWTEQVVSS